MKIYYFSLILAFLLVFSCSNSSDEPAQVDTVYTMEDASKLGIKNLMKNDFETDFSGTTESINSEPEIGAALEGS